MWKLNAEINFRWYLKCDFHQAGLYRTLARLIHVLTYRTQILIEIGNLIYADK
jgi:hypothetical protein